jgi:hypothetical protein
VKSSSLRDWINVAAGAGPVIALVAGVSEGSLLFALGLIGFWSAGILAVEAFAAFRGADSLVLYPP